MHIGDNITVCNRDTWQANQCYEHIIVMRMVIAGRSNGIEKKSILFSIILCKKIFILIMICAAKIPLPLLLDTPKYFSFCFYIFQIKIIMNYTVSPPTSDAYLIATIDNVTFQLIRYLSILIFIFGTIGNSLNILVLSQSAFRSSPCARTIVQKPIIILNSQ